MLVRFGQGKKDPVIFGPTAVVKTINQNGCRHTSTQELGLCWRVTTLLFFDLRRPLGSFVCDVAANRQNTHIVLVGFT